MSFDALAAAVDWLDAYRSRDVDKILAMYAEDALTECRCDGLTVTGRQGLAAYWQRRVREFPASDLDDLKPNGDGATINYITRHGVIGATIEFNADGQIAILRCGPSRAEQARLAAQEYANDERGLKARRRVLK